MTVRGSVNHTFYRVYGGDNPFVGVDFGRQFIATYRFLNSSIGASLGIVRRACNLNNGSADCDYAESNRAPRPGNNAWAVFEFTSANPPFWLLIQQSDSISNNAFGNSPGFPARIDGSGANDGIGGGTSGFAFAVAVREDGGSPWGGTTLNNGSDSKSNPVWTPGPSRLAMFPLNNGPRGQYRRTRSSMHRISYWYGGNVSDANINNRKGMFHIIATEDTIIFLNSVVDASLYDVAYFGSYNPIRGSTAANYCFFATLALRAGFFNDIATDVFWNMHGGARYYWNTHVVGNNTNTMTAAWQNGGTGGNYQWNGGVIDKASFSTVPIGLGSAMDFREDNIEYSRFLSSAPALANGRLTVYGLPVFVDGRSRGMVGELSNMWFCHSLPNHSSFNDKTRAVFGRWRMTGKFVVPWGGGIIPGRATTVNGEQF